MNEKGIKEYLTFLRLILTSALAFLAGCFAYLVNNIRTESPLILNLDTLAIITLVGIILYTGAEIKFYINKLY